VKPISRLQWNAGFRSDSGPSSVKNSETPDFGAWAEIWKYPFLQGSPVERAASLQIESGFEA
jgi:hypothetical protein